MIFIFLISCGSNTEHLPVLSYKVNTSGEKEIYSITYSNFINQDGNAFSTESITNKIVVANFFFTRCPSICPPMRTELIKVANDFINEDDVLLLSHSIDTANDTVSALKNYSEATQIPSSKWQFLTSSEVNIKAQAQQFMTNFRPNEKGTDFYHSSYVALIDKNQLIRGFYNILAEEEVNRLYKDLKILLE